MLILFLRNNIYNEPQVNYYPINLLKLVKQHLKSGGIIAYPTEHCYGLGCDPLNHKALNKLLQLKNRDPKKGFIVVAAKEYQLEKLIKPISSVFRAKIDKLWPGPFSLVLPIKNSSVPYSLHGKFNSLAVRVSSQKNIQQLCNYLDMALVSTSANKTGCKPIKNYSNCLRQFSKEIIVLPGIIGYSKYPSNIIDLQNEKMIR